MNRMDESIKTAFAMGYERMAAWSDLLDEINVYPVADADTGRNLRISLAPLKFDPTPNISRQLLMSATGNSGNIANAFFAEFARSLVSAGIFDAAVAGRSAAWKALQDPKPGTMLTVFDALVNVLRPNGPQERHPAPDPLLEQLKISVLSTTGLLDELGQADVVDSGALGMFLFFEGFFKGLAGQPDDLSNPYDLFGTKIMLSRPVTVAPDKKGYCIDTVIKPRDMDEAVDHISAMGKHVVAVADDGHLKVHLHATDEATAQSDIAAMGDMVRWKSEKIVGPRTGEQNPATRPGAVHIVTDAAGSLTHELAGKLGMTLLDSYILMGEQHLPESMVSAAQLYETMSRGTKVTTAQASTFERHQHYEYLTRRYDHLLYLCVGSAYTGNYDISAQWAGQNPEEHGMTVMDTGAASGRLGLIARHVAQYAQAGNAPEQVAQFAQDISRRCDELIFLDQLKFLAAGGRISKTSGFFGDLLKIKPIIRPGAQGAEKVGVVKNHDDQVDYLLNHLASELDPDAPADILLQYTDNKERVFSRIQPRIEKLLPRATIDVVPMSLTSGAHMGPGTWAAAFLPGQ